MSGRVNTKFIVLLSVVLLAVMGAAVFAASVVILKSGEDHARIARNAEAAGDWTQAERSWGNAVNEERGNVDWQRSYMNAIQKKPTTTSIEYATQYEKYRAVLRSIAETLRTDEEAHERYFDEFMLMLGSGTPSRDGYQVMIDEVGRIETLLYDQGDSDLIKNLRRYRGESVAVIAQIASDASDDFLKGGIKDLEDARSVRPGDYSIAEALFVIHSKMGERARDSRRMSEAEEAFGKAYDAAKQFADTNPNDVSAQFLLLRADIDKALLGIEAKQLFGPELTRARRNTLAAFADRAAELAELAASADPQQYTSPKMSLITGVIAQVDPENAADRLAKIWETASKKEADDRRLKFAYGQFLKQTGNHSEAINVFEKIADLPNVPVTTEGMLRFNDRNRALYLMADAAIERWSQMNAQTEGRGEWLERARSYTDRLGKEIAQDQPMMLFLNARLAYAAGELSKADRLFREFNTATVRSNPDGLKLAAEVANQLGNPGLEKELLEAAQAINATDVNTLVRLASVNIGLRDYPRAEQLLSKAYDIRPDIQAIKDQLDIVRAMIDSSNTNDPIKKILVEAQMAEDRGTPDAAIEILQKGIAENPDNVSLIIGLAQMLNNAQRYEEMSQIVDRGLAIEPNNRNLTALRTMAETAGNIDNKIRSVTENTDITELDRQLALHRLHLANEDPEAAKAALDAARAIDPSNKSVVVYSFDEAIRAKNLVEAKRIYEANKDRDIDGADGLAMRARIELAEGDKESARRTLESAVERGSVNAITMKLLADVQMELGETFKALENYKRAIGVRPNDIELLKGYISVLTRLGRMNEALDQARRTLSIGQRDEQFREMWLNLEGMVGDKQLAYNRRLTLDESGQGSSRNSAMLISLALDLRKFDEARARLDQARAKEDSLLLASLDARYYADRNEIQKAIDVYSAFIPSAANDQNDPTAYLAFGQFLIDHNLVDNGLTTLRQARLVQDPKAPVADAVLADKLFELRRYSEAVPVLNALISADFQAEVAQSRLIECYIRMNQPQEAQRLIDGLSDEQKNTISMMLMRSDVQALLGNSNEAAQLIDQAIQDYPEDPLAYMKRATRLMANRATMGDAIDDLTRAIELNPANADAYRFRSLVNNELGNAEDAARDIVLSAEAAPENLQLRLGAIKRLIEMDRDQMAADLVDTSLKRRPTDLALMLGAGDTFTAAGRHRTALQYYELAWNQSKTFAVGQRLAASLLEQPRPDLRRARQIAQDPTLSSGESAAISMLRARIESKGENPDGVRTNLSAAYELIKENPNQLAVWTGSLTELLGSHKAAVDYLNALDRDRSLTQWSVLLQGQLMMSDDTTKDEGLRKITRVIDTASDPSIKLTAQKIRSMGRYAAGDYTGAADDMRKGLELNPNDAELNNNLAYTLARHLNQAAEAEPLARKAVELDPNSRAALDTLGLVLIENNKAPEAVTVLERALSLAQTDVDRAPVLVHLGRARLASGNPIGAQDAVTEAGTIMSGDASTFSDEVRAELEQVRAELRNQ